MVYHKEEIMRIVHEQSANHITHPSLKWKYCQLPLQLIVGDLCQLTQHKHTFDCISPWIVTDSTSSEQIFLE